MPVQLVENQFFKTRIVKLRLKSEWSFKTKFVFGANNDYLTSVPFLDFLKLLYLFEKQAEADLLSSCSFCKCLRQLRLVHAEARHLEPVWVSHVGVRNSTTIACCLPQRVRRSWSREWCRTQTRHSGRVHRHHTWYLNPSTKCLPWCFS